MRCVALFIFIFNLPCVQACDLSFNISNQPDELVDAVKTLSHESEDIKLIIKVDKSNKEDWEIVLTGIMRNIELNNPKLCLSLTLDLDESINEIGNNFLRNFCTIKKIIIPAFVQRFGENFLRNNKNLIELKIVGYFAEAGSGFLLGCKGLEILSVPYSLWLLVVENQFCLNLHTLNINNGVKCIDANCLSCYKKMINVSIPSSVEDIKGDFFLLTKNIVDLKIPYKLICRADAALEKPNKLICKANAVLEKPKSKNKSSLSRLKKIKIFKKNEKREFFQSTFLSHDEKPSQLLFKNLFPNLKNLELSDEPIEIYDYFGYGCCFLRKVIIPDSVEKLGASFLGGSGVSEVFLPHGIKEIGPDFLADSCIKEIEFPKSLSVVPHGSLCGCLALSKIIMHNNVSHIGSNFAGNPIEARSPSLKEFVMPSSVIEVGNGFLYRNYALKKLVLSPNIKSIYPRFLYKAVRRNIQHGHVLDIIIYLDPSKKNYFGDKHEYCNAFTVFLNDEPIDRKTLVETYGYTFNISIYSDYNLCLFLPRQPKRPVCTNG